MAKATVSSRLIWAAPRGPYGLVTACTCGSRATRASIAVTAVWMAGSRTVPVVACSTIWSVSPDAAGKSRWSSVSAAADGVPGSWNWVVYRDPAS